MKRTPEGYDLPPTLLRQVTGRGALQEAPPLRRKAWVKR